MHTKNANISVELNESSKMESKHVISTQIKKQNIWQTELNQEYSVACKIPSCHELTKTNHFWGPAGEMAAHAPNVYLLSGILDCLD